tara:strand:- start:1779 stop:2624 length:846 start_codon:yes stop_codon:yes gene_type:complete
MNYRNLIKIGTSILRDNAISSANLDAELLLSISLKRSREKILLNLEQKSKFSEFKNYLKLINKRKNRVPVSLISKKRFFWKGEFFVNNNVLTPRFETEILIEEVLKKCARHENINILDIGAGSGCIIISLLKEKSSWRGTALDVSSLALNVARINAKMQQIDNRIKFINSDIDKLNSNKYDLIISNPPYINKIEYNNLDLGVKNFEPKTALYGGIDGLKIIEKIVKRSKFVLKLKGLLALEIGLGQYYQVKNLLEMNGFFVSKVIKDYQNIIRCLIAIKIK